MTATNPAAITQAILNDLTANTTLTPTTTWDYAEPVAPDPQKCPMLAVWCENSDYTIISGGNGTAAYTRTHHVTIAWYVFGPLMADTGGTGDPATVQALDATAETIITRAATYSTGIPTIGPQLIGTLISRQLVPKAGAIWSLQLAIELEEAA